MNRHIRNEAGLAVTGALLAGAAALVIVAAAYVMGEHSASSTDAVDMAPSTTETISTSDTSEPIAAPQTSATKSTIAPAQKAEPSGRLCTANDLSGTASWERTDSYIAGTLRVKNSSSSGCVLSRDSSVSIESGTTSLANIMTIRPDASALIKAGDTHVVRFTWLNWCGAALARPGYVRFTLPLDGGYLRVPAIDSLGRPQSEAPVCVMPGVASTVGLDW